jgi:hypothetical protein
LEKHKPFLKPFRLGQFANNCRIGFSQLVYHNRFLAAPVAPRPRGATTRANSGSQTAKFFYRETRTNNDIDNPLLAVNAAFA